MRTRIFTPNFDDNKDYTKASSCVGFVGYRRENYTARDANCIEVTIDTKRKHS